MISHGCSVPSCGKPHDARGYCKNHYMQLRHSGELQPLPRLTMEERFWRHVDKSLGESSCWPWTGTKTRYGYGEYQPRKGLRRAAHRFAYEFATGEELGVFQVDHLCHNRLCCNPAHLRPATSKQNSENLSAAHRDSKSGIRGVYWRESVGQWRAQVKHNYRAIHVGWFDSVEDAEAAVLAKRLELFTHSDMTERSADG